MRECGVSALGRVWVEECKEQRDIKVGRGIPGMAQVEYDQVLDETKGTSF